MIFIAILFYIIPIPEELVFDIRYGPFSAGEIRLYIEQIDTIYKISCTEKTKGLMSGIYRINDRYEIWVDSAFIPILYEDWIEEGGYKRHRKIEFNHEQGVAVYQDKYNLELHSNAREIFSLIYYTRTLSISSGDTLKLWLHAGKKNAEIVVPVAEKVFDGETYLAVSPEVGDIKVFGGKGLTLYYDRDMVPARFSIGLWFGTISAIRKELN